MTKPEFARAFAEYVHAGQLDEDGTPFVNHPIAVAGKLIDEEEKTVAYLHDVIEDTDTKLETVADLFGIRIADAVDAISKRHGEEYEAYIERLSQNSLACRVKLADLAHNIERTLAQPPEERNPVRYKKHCTAQARLRQLMGIANQTAH